MAEKTSKLLQIRVTPSLLKRLHKRRLSIGMTMKEMVTRILAEKLADK